MGVKRRKIESKIEESEEYRKTKVKEDRDIITYLIFLY